MKNFSLKHKNSSVNIAKHRLQSVLFSDRMYCSSDIMEQMREDLYHTISKYMEIDPKNFELKLTRKDMHIKYTGEK